LLSGAKERLRAGRRALTIEPFVFTPEQKAQWFELVSPDGTGIVAFRGANIQKEVLTNLKEGDGNLTAVSATYYPNQKDGPSIRPLYKTGVTFANFPLENICLTSRMNTMTTMDPDLGATCDTRQEMKPLPVDKVVQGLQEIEANIRQSSRQVVLHNELVIRPRHQDYQRSVPTICVSEKRGPIDQLLYGTDFSPWSTTFKQLLEVTEEKAQRLGEKPEIWFIFDGKIMRPKPAHKEAVWSRLQDIAASPENLQPPSHAKQQQKGPQR
jgi:hypothetical protein